MERVSISKTRLRQIYELLHKMEHELLHPKLRANYRGNLCSSAHRQRRYLCKHYKHILQPE